MLTLLNMEKQMVECNLKVDDRTDCLLSVSKYFDLG